MNKLVNILNEFEKYKTSRAYKIWFVKNWEIHNTAMPDMFNNSFYWVFICSIEYWFIERLVEQDKIDFDNRELKDKFMEEFERYPTFQGNTYSRDFNVNGLLMLISIQEHKLKFLIDLLK